MPSGPCDADRGRPVPPNLNWDEWVGPAPMRLYKSGYYHPWNWRGWLDFGSGPMGDFGCHNMNLPFRALKLDYPVGIDINAELLGLPTYPKRARIDYHYAQRGNLPPVTLTWYDGGRRPDPALIPRELIAHFEGQQPVTLDKNGKQVKRPAGIGDGTLILGENGFTFGGERSGSDYIFLKSDPKLWGILNHPACKNVPQTLPQSPGHVREWIDACLGSKQPPFSDFETGGHLTEIALSGVVALKTGKNLEWTAAR